jgi:hypothetical protein
LDGITGSVGFNQFSFFKMKLSIEALCVERSGSSLLAADYADNAKKSRRQAAKSPASPARLSDGFSLRRITDGSRYTRSRSAAICSAV